MTRTDEENFDIVIVGYGPVGATLAHLLGLHGVQVLVLEREAATYHLPRAVHFDDEVMRIFQWTGLAPQVEAITRFNPGMKFVDPDGVLLLDWPRSPDLTRQGWRSSYRMHQPDLEDVLRQGLAARKTVTARSRCDAFFIEEREDHVHVRYEDLSNGDIRRVRARYVVGCDGARSLVRRFIESDMEDFGFHERWLVLDVLLKREKPELGDHSVQFCNPDRPATYVRGPGNRRRWEITVLPHEDSVLIADSAEVWKLLKPWLSPDEADLERAAVYTFHSLAARRWRRGRLLIAGDAAHQTPPFLGQGMCAGIRDAANLGWKLAEALRAPGGDALLESYESERLPNVREYIEAAIRLGGLINTSDPQPALGVAMQRPDGGSHMDSISPSLGPGIGDGPHRGRLFPQPRLGDGRRMDEAALYEWLLVAEPRLAGRAAPPSNVKLVTAEDGSEAAACLAKLGTAAALLRPDRHIFGTAETAASLQGLLANPYLSTFEEVASKRAEL